MGWSAARPCFPSRRSSDLDRTLPARSCDARLLRRGAFSDDEHTRKEQQYPAIGERGIGSRNPGGVEPEKSLALLLGQRLEKGTQACGADEINDGCGVAQRMMIGR